MLNITIRKNELKPWHTTSQALLYLHKSVENKCTCMCRAALFTIVQMPIDCKWINKCVISIQWNIKKEWSTDPCYNVDESPKYFANWKKPYAKCHILYYFIYIILVTGKSVEIESRFICFGDLRKGGNCLMSKWYYFRMIKIFWN